MKKLLILLISIAGFSLFADEIDDWLMDEWIRTLWLENHPERKAAAPIAVSQPDSVFNGSSYYRTLWAVRDVDNSVKENLSKNKDNIYSIFTQSDEAAALPLYGSWTLYYNRFEDGKVYTTVHTNLAMLFDETKGMLCRITDDEIYCTVSNRVETYSKDWKPISIIELYNEEKQAEDAERFFLVFGEPFWYHPYVNGRPSYRSEHYELILFDDGWIVIEDGEYKPISAYLNKTE